MLELAVAAWNGAITQKEKLDIERVQKTALHIMLWQMYQSYGDALKLVGLETLDARRQKLCLKFEEKKVVKHKKFTNWFVPNDLTVNTRQKHERFLPVYCKHKRF